MNFYVLLNVPIPKDYYLTPFITACHQYLENFIEVKTLFGPTGKLVTYNEVNSIFDLSDPAFKTIGIRVNPYKAITLFYKDWLREGPMSQAYFENAKDFTELVKLIYDPGNPRISQFKNNWSTYGPVNYLLDFDNFAEDVKRIPEFANVQDTNYLSLAQSDSMEYKDLFNEETKQIVETVWAADIAAYGYTF